MQFCQTNGFSNKKHEIGKGTWVECGGCGPATFVQGGIMSDFLLVGLRPGGFCPTFIVLDHVALSRYISEAIQCYCYHMPINIHM